MSRYYDNKTKKANEFFNFFWFLIKGYAVFMVCSAIAHVIMLHI